MYALSVIIVVVVVVVAALLQSVKQACNSDAQKTDKTHAHIVFIQQRTGLIPQSIECKIIN